MTTVPTYIIDKDANQIDASLATIPSDSLFRDAWTLSGSVITEDLDAAKEIFRKTIRMVRAELFPPLDTAFMKAQETAADTTEIVASKQALRDAPAAAAIANATTIDELKAAWDTDLLGESPYTP